MKIYGAGMSGLLAARMLKHMNPVVHEAADKLPNNHAALLRFRSDAVSKATGIEFKKVWVQKSVMEDGKLTNNPSIAAQNLYGYKVANKIAGRSIMNLAPGERYIAPEDFISRLAEGVNIKYNSPLLVLEEKSEPTISTIPMDVLMKAAGWDEGKDFKFQQITTVTADIASPDCDVYQTIYYPELGQKPYRASITGKKLIIECMSPVAVVEGDAGWHNALARSVIKDFFPAKVELENVAVKNQYYGKLLESESSLRKQFIMAMTDRYGIYSVGRFATWRQILMDDVVQDIKLVQAMVEGRENYSRRLRIGQ